MSTHRKDTADNRNRPETAITGIPQDETVQPVDIEIDIFLYDLYLKNELTTRAYNVLSRIGKSTLNEVSGLTENDILKCRNAGKATVNEIHDVLNRYGLGLKAQDDREQPEKQDKTEEKPAHMTVPENRINGSLSLKAHAYLKERVQRLEDIENHTVFTMLLKDLPSDSQMKKELLQWLWEKESKRHNQRIGLLKKEMQADTEEQEELQTGIIRAVKNEDEDISIITAFMDYAKVDYYYKMPIALKSARIGLHRNNIDTLGDLTSLTESGLMKIPHIGRHTVGILKEILAEHNLSLKAG